MEITSKKLENISTLHMSNTRKQELHKVQEQPRDEDTVNVKGLAPEVQSNNSKKVSELKNKYEAGTLSYDTKDVAKAFLKEAVGIY